MKGDQRTEYLTRDRILGLLSDEEVARVSTAESAAHLSDGDEYLDLEQLERGVLQARGSTTPMGRILAKRAVHEHTWCRILTQLTESPIETVPPGA
jgi:hypothetical protein